MVALVVGTNSYASQADADTYFANSTRATTWSAFTSDQKDEGLIDATRLLERLSWQGTKTNPSQTLEFPRDGLVDCNGEPVSSAESLIQISEAEFEYAIAILSDSSVLTSTDVTGKNIKKLEAGSAKITFFRPTTGSRTPLLVNEIISCFLLGSISSGVSGGSVVTGTSDSSSFTDPDCSFGLKDGFA